MKQVEDEKMRENIEVMPVTPDLGRVLAPAPNSSDYSLPQADSELIELFKNSGVLLFRGFEIDRPRFVAYTEALTPDFIDYSGGAYARDKIGGNATVLSVTGHRQFFAVPLHGEMFYTKHRPTILWFFCVAPPVEGGQTTVCDGVALLNQLSAETRALFEAQPINYIRHYEDGVWQKIYQSDDVARVEAICRERDTEFSHHAEDNSISTQYRCSAITQPLYTDQPAFVNNILPVMVQEANGHTHSLVRFADGSKIPEDVISELKEVSERLTVEVNWQEGDLVMVDNSRLMHGRRAFDDTQRELNMRMSATVFS